MDKSGLGKAIRKHREKKGISQEDFAKMVGVKKAVVSHWELGRKEPTATRFVSIVRVLGVKIFRDLDKNAS